MEETSLIWCEEFKSKIGHAIRVGGMTLLAFLSITAAPANRGHVWAQVWERGRIALSSDILGYWPIGRKSRGALLISWFTSVFLSPQSSLKVNHVEHSAEITHHLVINKSSSTFKQNQSAACGLVYMEKALGRIRDHQRKLINDEHVQTQFKDIITRLNEHVMPCAHHVLAKCGQDPQPIFPVSHFKAKKWIRNFLDSSVKFLHQVIHLLETSKNHEEHHWLRF